MTEELPAACGPEVTRTRETVTMSCANCGKDKTLWEEHFRC